LAVHRVPREALQEEGEAPHGQEEVGQGEGEAPHDQEEEDQAEEEGLHLWLRGVEEGEEGLHLSDHLREWQALRRIFLVGRSSLRTSSELQISK
jgi:hypothetical protein